MIVEWAIRIELEKKEKEKLTEALEIIKNLRENICEVTNGDEICGTEELSGAIDVIENILNERLI